MNLISNKEMKGLFNQKNIKRKKAIYIGIFFIIILLEFVGGPREVYAFDTLATLKNVSIALLSSPILVALGTIAVLVMGVFGALDSLVISALVNISKYNNFIHEEAIKNAWVIVRDLSNMFFILVLLVIAFATILRIESYSMKRWLPKLLIMAVLINFSRTICGLIIDFAQVIMLTFVNTWATNGGDFVDMTKMVTYFKGNFTKNFTTNDWSVLKVVVGMIIGIMFLVVSGIVLLTTLAIFIMRVIMLWIYIVLSPIAFLMSAFPAGQQYASRWWNDFIKQVTIGPILAFFIWLALIGRDSIDKIGAVTANGNQQCFGITEASCLNTFLPFILSIGFLLGGLIISQQVGGAIGSAAGRGIAAIRKGQAWGTARLKRWSGYDAVADHTKAYMAMRRSRREDRIRDSVGTISQGLGKAKDTLVARPAKWIGVRTWGRFSGKHEKEEAEKELRRKEEEKREINDRIEDRQEFILEGMKYKYIGDNKWGKYNEHGEKEGEIEHEKLQEDITKSFENTMESLKEKIRDLSKKQRSRDLKTKIVLAGLGATAGAFTGGAALGVLGGIAGGIYGAAAGGLGVPAAGKAIREAGKADLNLASNYEYKKVNEERDALKLKRPDELRNIMNDETKSSYERMAASLELISQKETNAKEIKEMRGRLVSKFGDKVKGAFEGLVRKNYVAAAKAISKEEVKGLIEAGVLTLKDMDDDSINKYSAQIVKGMKLGTFRNQFKAASDSKKEVIKNALRKVDDYAGRKMLAYVENIKDAFGNRNEEIQKFVSELKMKDIKDIINEGTREQRQAFGEAIKKHYESLGDLKSQIESDTPEAQNIRDALGIETKAKKKEKPEPGTAPGARAGFQ
jgi:hypothetical protein